MDDSGEIGEGLQIKENDDYRSTITTNSSMLLPEESE